jgi:hypothetical protein
MHETMSDVGGPGFFLTAIIARWNRVYSVFNWINCGHPPPLVLGAGETVDELATRPDPPLGSSNARVHSTGTSVACSPATAS